MTEAAAHRVLNLVDGAAPGCDEIAARTERLGARIQQHGSAPIAEVAPPLLAECADYAAHVGSFAETQRSVLTDIMLAQDFQDLSGQVIGRIIDIITRTEQQLLDLLVQSGPGEVSVEEPQLEGPQIPDKAMKQDDVDDLLASLGF
jgi:chemotaxis protein CheZ